MLANLSGALMATTGIVHSVIGERRLVGPLLRARDGVLAVPLARMVLRFAWHITTILMVLCAAAVVWPGTPVGLVATIGAAWLVAGIVDIVWSRGRHIGGPPITLAGALALAPIF